MYSGGEPSFVEDSIFKITIPLNSIAATKVGPDSVSTDFGTTEVSTEVKLDKELLDKLLIFCGEPRSRKKMQDFCGIQTEKYFREHIIKPMLKEEMIKRTIPDKPNSSKQKYIAIKL